MRRVGCSRCRRAFGTCLIEERGLGGVAIGVASVEVMTCRSFESVDDVIGVCDHLAMTGLEKVE